VNLRDLRYLVTLADTLHFGRAAEACHVSQPTLSAQIKKLEEYLGTPLVERRPRHVQLTETGQQVVERARRLLKEADDIRDVARTDRDPLAGRLRVGLIPTIAPYLLPRVAPKIRRALPKLNLMLYEYQTTPLLERVRAGELDLAILALPAETEGLDTRALFAEAFVVAVPARHPLATRKRLRPADLDGEHLLLLEDGHCLRDQALEVCSTTGAVEDTDFRATSLETLRQMVAAGLGITLLPRLAAEGAYAAARGLTTLPFAPPTPQRMVGAAWRPSTTRRQAIDAVCKVIATAID
jgi:LysR family hydrogen peroxide-inducible transcriptional activator